jgi:DNA gyrase/topoisomerase IV subunit B
MVYDASMIRLLRFDEHVRARPTMYFGVQLGDPRLATKVFRAVLIDATHNEPLPRVEADVLAGFTFWVTDDQPVVFREDGTPLLGINDTLFRADRTASAAAAVLSTRTVIERWHNGRGFRQELVHGRPTTPPKPFASPKGDGTRVLFDLDPAYCGHPITAGLA